MTIKFNNPLNLDYVESIKWNGLADPPFQGRFCSFTSSVFGIRAGCMNIIHHFDRGANTIEKLITIWAPPTENDTKAYISDVSGRSGFTSDQVLNFHSYADLRPVIEAMIWHENGEQPYSNAMFDEALKLAGVVKPSPAWVKNPKVLGPGIATVATGIQQTVGQVQPIWDGLNRMGFRWGCFNAQIVFGALGFIAFMGIVWGGYSLYKSHKVLAA